MDDTSLQITATDNYRHACIYYFVLLVLKEP